MPLSPAALGIVLNTKKTEVLLVKRQDVPVWVLPGGGIDLDETPEEAVIRELYEESGLKVFVCRLAAEYTPINRLAAKTYVFICDTLSGELRCSAETSEVAFFPLTELPSNLFHLHAQWLEESLKSTQTLRRPLTEVSYFSLIKYFITHPWQVLRFAWTRLF